MTMQAPNVLIILYPVLYYYYVRKLALEKGSRWQTDCSRVIYARRAINHPQTFDPVSSSSASNMQSILCIFTSPWKRQCDLLIGCWWLNIYSQPRAVRLATPLNSTSDFFDRKLFTSSWSFKREVSVSVGRTVWIDYLVNH